MLALIIIGVILAVIVLIMLIPVGADVAFENSELRVSGKLCGMLIQLYPKLPEEEKPEKKKKKTEEAKQEEPGKEKKPLQLPKFNKDELLELAKAGIGAAGKFGRKIKVDRFLLHYVAAGRDPYNTAVTFGYVNAALSSLAPMCAARFTVKDCSVWTDVDFTRDDMQLDFGLAMSIRIGQILGIGMGVGFKALGILLRNRKRIKNEAQTQINQPSAEAPAVTENTNTENIQDEERKNSNG